MKIYSAPVISINKYDVQYALGDNPVRVTRKQLNEIASRFAKTVDNEEFWQQFTDYLQRIAVDVLNEKKPLTK